MEKIHPQRTILKLFSISLKNSFLKDWRCRGEPRTATTSNMELFLTLVHSVTTSFILGAATALGPQPYADILYAS